MNEEGMFRLMLAVLLIGIFIIRIYYRRVAGKSEGKITKIEGGWNVIFRIVIGLTGLILLLLEVVYPEALAWAHVDLPAGARWVGAGLGAGGLALLLWVHQALRENFSGTLHIREEHALVTNGPYRWARHPMYTSFYLLIGAFFLLSANWLIGLGWLAGQTAVLLARIGPEEAVMQQKFGPAYRDYMQRTGRFLPPLPIR